MTLLISAPTSTETLELSLDSFVTAERRTQGVTAGETAPTRRGSGAGDASLGGGPRKILTALAQYPGGRTKQQVAILTGYAHGGGGFDAVPPDAAESITEQILLTLLLATLGVFTLSSNEVWVAPNVEAMVA